MIFTQSRKAAAVVASQIQRDLESSITSVEKLAGKDKRAAGRRMSRLVVDFALNYALPMTARFSIVDAILMDAEKNGLPYVPALH
jgi:hypothetical protein